MVPTSCGRKPGQISMYWPRVVTSAPADPPPPPPRALSGHRGPPRVTISTPDLVFSTHPAANMLCTNHKSSWTCSCRPDNSCKVRLRTLQIRRGSVLRPRSGRGPAEVPVSTHSTASGSLRPGTRQAHRAKRSPSAWTSAVIGGAGVNALPVVDCPPRRIGNAGSETPRADESHATVRSRTWMPPGRVVRGDAPTLSPPLQMPPGDVAVVQHGAGRQESTLLQRLRQGQIGRVTGGAILTEDDDSGCGCDL